MYETLLESTRAIPWKVDWASMTFAYIGPQIEALLGWELMGTDRQLYQAKKRGRNSVVFSR